MPVANQYGVDLGNILSTVSDLKTAQQNRETNALRNDMLSRQNQEDIATNDAEQQYLADPKTAVAHSVAQKLQWGKLEDAEKIRTAETIKKHLSDRGAALNNIINIQDPAQQKQALLQAVSTLTPDEQEGMSKYGSSVDEWQQNLPRMMNDLLVIDGGISLLQKQAEEKTKHENKIEEINALYDNKNALADKANKTKIDVANIGAKAREQLAKYKAANGGGKPTVLEMKAAALVDGGQAKNMNEAIRSIMSSTKTTNVNDPIYGKKTTTSTSTYGNALKPPLPIVKVNTRDQAVQAIKSKYPSATPQQIDSYLKSKGL